MEAQPSSQSYLPMAILPLGSSNPQGREDPSFVLFTTTGYDPKTLLEIVTTVTTVLNECVLSLTIHLSRPKSSHVRGAHQPLCEPMRRGGGGEARPMRDQHWLPLAVTPARHAAAHNLCFPLEHPLLLRFPVSSHQF